jgi:predicted GH43/DUF377 family glycosyl hydrolase
LSNKCFTFLFIVIPAKAGIQPPAVDWTPAFAGETTEERGGYFATAPWEDGRSTVKMVPRFLHHILPWLSLSWIAALCATIWHIRDPGGMLRIAAFGTSAARGNGTLRGGVGLSTEGVPMLTDADYLIFRPDYVDLAHSPLRRSLDAPTYVLGAFNPGLTRLPGGNLLMMVRVAEALREPIWDGHVHAIRGTPAGYVLDAYPLAGVSMSDPRQFDVSHGSYRMLGLTSLSWLLPVELSPDGRIIEAIHYDRIIAPAASYQEYGVEDPRISRIGDMWYMTTCSASAERHCSTLYGSHDGLNYELKGVVLDHQNKDMILFEGKIREHFVALTRPLGELYLAYPPDSVFAGGPSINLAGSPDALHWKPFDEPFIRPRKSSIASMKLGGGSPPILTDRGWLMLYHGVEMRAQVGIYRTFWALLDRDDPAKILRLEEDRPLLEANPALTGPIEDMLYLPTEVVFTTGIVDGGDHYIVASGEADLACRITHIPKTRFA